MQKGRPNAIKRGAWRATCAVAVVGKIRWMAMYEIPAKNPAITLAAKKDS